MSESAQAVLTKYHRLGGLNDRNLFPMILEPGNLRSECQQGECLVRTLFGLQTAAFLLCPHMAFPQCTGCRGREEASTLVSLLTRALISSRGPHPHDFIYLTPITSRRSHLQIPSHWGLGLQHINLGEQNSVHCRSNQNSTDKLKWNTKRYSNNSKEGRK